MSGLKFPYRAQSQIPLRENIYMSSTCLFLVTELEKLGLLISLPLEVTREAFRKHATPNKDHQSP